MTNLSRIAAGLALALAACTHDDTGPSARAPEAAEEEPALSADEAQAIALAQVPGTVVERELEREDGRLVYSIEIQPGSGGGVKEVVIDAASGVVVGIEDDDGDRDEGDDDDRGE